MKLKTQCALKRLNAGFTLIELLVVILIIGILAAIAVPQYFKVVEKGKVTEAYSWLGGLKAAQERHLAKDGDYYTGGAVAADTFDADLGSLTYFDASVGVGPTPPDYVVVFTRRAPLPAVYGDYTLTFTRSTGVLDCGGAGAGACRTDLLP